MHKNVHEIIENIGVKDILDSNDELVLHPKEGLSASSFVVNKPKSLFNAVQEIWNSKRVDNQVIRAMTTGGFKEHVVRMANKHIIKGRTLPGDILVINSYDDAEHTSTKKDKTRVFPSVLKYVLSQQ